MFKQPTICNKAVAKLSVESKALQFCDSDLNDNSKTQLTDNNCECSSIKRTLLIWPTVIGFRPPIFITGPTIAFRIVETNADNCRILCSTKQPKFISPHKHELIRNRAVVSQSIRPRLIREIFNRQAAQFNLKSYLRADYGEKTRIENRVTFEPMNISEASLSLQFRRRRKFFLSFSQPVFCSCRREHNKNEEKKPEDDVDKVLCFIVHKVDTCSVGGWVDGGSRYENVKYSNLSTT